MVPPGKIPEPWPPITNGPASTVHSATAQPEGGAQDIAARERMGHFEGIFLTKPENSLPIGIEPSHPRLGGGTRKSLTASLEALSLIPATRILHTCSRHHLGPSQIHACCKLCTWCFRHGENGSLSLSLYTHTSYICFLDPMPIGARFWILVPVS